MGCQNNNKAGAHCILATHGASELYSVCFFLPFHPFSLLPVGGRGFLIFPSIPLKVSEIGIARKFAACI